MVDALHEYTALELHQLLGRGTLYLYGPEVLFRAQPVGTYRFVFNVMYD